MLSPFDNFMFSFIPVFGSIFFVLVFGIIIFTIIKGITTWNNNNHQPVLSVTAKIVTKRTRVSSHMHSANDSMHHHHSSTSYYITFEVESRDRIEFSVGSNEYGLLVEGDVGKLTFQGTRFLKFEREF